MYCYKCLKPLQDEPYWEGSLYTDNDGDTLLIMNVEVCLDCIDTLLVVEAGRCSTCLNPIHKGAEEWWDFVLYRNKDEDFRDRRMFHEACIEIKNPSS